MTAVHFLHQDLRGLCDYETCLNFFEMLVEYAGK